MNKLNKIENNRQLCRKPLLIKYLIESIDSNRAYALDELYRLKRKSKHSALTP